MCIKVPRAASTIPAPSPAVLSNSSGNFGPDKSWSNASAAHSADANNSISLAQWNNNGACAYPNLSWNSSNAACARGAASGILSATLILDNGATL